MYLGMLAPHRNCAMSSEKLLQLCLKRLYVAPLENKPVSSTRYTSGVISTEILFSQRNVNNLITCFVPTNKSIQSKQCKQANTHRIATFNAARAEEVLPVVDHDGEEKRTLPISIGDIVAAIPPDKSNPSWVRKRNMGQVKDR
ncbi:hypothetical protein NQ315_001541 [Exocentrus adspersus]|uniref:Uncharacterized protein n=1 Tax=Exocentrus adspersus TaxID=1586481 RepID=A0AAV8W918_9CUCU|nr:hypothetical protein NQ315_001541 [Exocentrus adspersus]